MDYKKILDKYLILPIYFKIGIFVLFWSLITVAAFFLTINPQFETIEKKSFKLAKLRKQTQAIVKVTKQLKNFKKELKQLEYDFQVALKKLPDSKEIPGLLLHISEFGNKDNLDFLMFKPGKVTKKEFYGIIPISIKLNGKYKDVGKFLYEVATMPRIVQIPKFLLKPNKDGTLYMDGKLETYIFLKEKLNEKNKKKKKNAKKK
jgi:type IV pilus assembly protein PilO